MLKPYDKEFMKAAILKHDQIFKEQVHELHRLYGIQKVLMSNIPTNNNNNINSNQQQLQANSQKQNSVQVGLGNNKKQLISSNVVDTTNSNNQMLGVGGKLIEEDEIDLTLGLSNHYRTNSGNVDRNQIRKKTIISNGNNQKPPRSNSSGQTQSSSSTGSSQTNKKTHNSMLRPQAATAAATGHELFIKDSQDFSRQLAWGLAQGNGNGIPPAGETNHALTFQLNRTAGNITHNAAGNFNTSSHGAGDDQHMRQNPPWLHQAQSLKLT